MAGLSRFPPATNNDRSNLGHKLLLDPTHAPAEKICSAAAMSIGCRCPTTFLRLSRIVSMSVATGESTSANSASGERWCAVTMCSRCCSVLTSDSIRAGVRTARRTNGRDWVKSHWRGANAAVWRGPCLAQLARSPELEVEHASAQRSIEEVKDRKVDIVLCDLQPMVRREWTAQTQIVWRWVCEAKGEAVQNNIVHAAARASQSRVFSFPTSGI